VVASVSELAIDDGLIPVEQPPAPPQIPESPVSEVVSVPKAEPSTVPSKTAKVAVRVDRAAVSRRTPASTVGANSAALKNTLVSAVEGGKPKIIEQLLNRGVPPDTGSEKNAVHIAVNRQDVESLKLLLEFGADPDSLNKSQRTAISYACYLKEELVKLLLDFGADPNLVAPELLPLPWAIDANKLAHVQLLLQYGADPNGNSKNGQTNLYYAAQRPVPKILHELLDWGADPNKANPSRDTPLVRASESRDAENVKILLAHGALPNVSDQQWAPLPWIIDSGNVDLVRYFLEHGGDPNAFSENGENNMVYAALHSVEIIRALIDHGGNINNKSKSGMTPLVAASRGRKFDSVKFLIANGANPNLSAGDWAALPWIIDSGNEEVVRYMLEHGTDPNASSKNGWINMFYAVEKPYEKIVLTMIEHGGDLNKKNAGGQTLLENACRCNRPEVMRVLLASGADPNQKGQHYPIFHSTNKLECLQTLLAAGADTNLHPGLVELATYHGQIELVKLLLDHGVHIDEPHLNIHRALVTSIRDNRPEIFAFLLERGANPNLKGDNFPLERALTKPQFLKPLIAAGADAKLIPGLLELAAWHNQIESVRILLDDAKVDINEKRPSGHGAVTTAIRDNRVDILAELIARRADLNMETCDGVPIVMAAKFEDPKRLHMLLDAGVDVNKTDRNRGYTALMQACAAGRMNAVQLLIQHGADVEMTSRKGEAGMDIAAKEGHEEIVMALLEGME
jgi:ankyrin repeat protein